MVLAELQAVGERLLTQWAAGWTSGTTGAARTPVRPERNQAGEAEVVAAGQCHWLPERFQADGAAERPAAVHGSAAARAPPVLFPPGRDLGRFAPGTAP